MKILSAIKNFFNRHSKLRFLTKCLTVFLIGLIVLGLVTFGGLEAACRPTTSKSQVNSSKPELADADIRPEVSTYLSYPEWFIVYSSDEYAQFLANNKPSHFPYFGSIGQYWNNYCRVFAITKAKGEFNAGDHLMLFVIGYSYSAELGIKGVYENTLGRVTEIFGHYPATAEDVYAHHIAKDYVNFIRLRPWYEYNFAWAFKGLWTDTNFFGRNFPRKVERKIILSLEYLVKTVYGKLIGLGSHSVYGIASTETYVVASNVESSVFTTHPEIKKVKELEPKSYIMVIPRYQPFTDLAPKLAKEGVQFVEVAGNREIFLTALVNRDVSYKPSTGQIVFETNILTNPDKKRIGLSVPTEFLSQALVQLQNKQGFIEHIFDY
jgi:hypothetical protein